MAWRACGLVILYLLSQFPKHSMAAIFNDSVSIGFSGSNMRFVDDEGLFLRSQNSTFVIGLLNLDGRNNYYLCIKHMSSGVVVWTANRNSPISNSDDFTLSLNGEAAVVTGNNVKVWSSGTAGFGVKKMQLQDSGNLVLLNGANQTIWQSFDHPTDTLLAGQIFRQGMNLVSSSSSNISSGQYSLSMLSGNLLLLIGFNPPQAYWTLAKDARAVRLSSGKPSFARLDETGLSLADNDSTVVLQLTFTDGMATTLLRAWLRPDGNFQLLSFVAGIWSSHFTAIENECALPLSCGAYGICSNSGQCSCPGFLRPLNSSDLSHGCQGPASRCSATSHAPFQRIGTGVEYFANQFSTPVITSGIPACQQRCEQNCSCVSFFYYQESNLCFLFSQLGTLQQSGNKNYSAYIKLYGLSQSELSPSPQSNNAPKFLLPLIIGGACLVIISMISYFAFWLHRTNLKSAASNEEPQDDEIFLEYMAGLPTRFSYKELEIATNKFSKRLGSGGFGSVYEGTLPDRSKVAVKQLEGIGQGKKEFRAEVAIIGSIHHVHLVRLRGFCAEGAHRLLVYEFMANGSLDKCLFYSEDSNVLDWSRRYSIAIGTAKGLAYLHDDCREKIIHCDIKPENILLNESYAAKVSDFGLAKLINKEQSQVFTTLRGTRGYLAPEWLMNLRLSEKSDVYSFGMVLLEIISGRKNFDPSETSEKWYFPAYAFRQAENGRLEDLVDNKLKETAIVEQVVRAVRVALWCIQEEANIRPSMGKVVQMLEGNIEVQDPPLTSILAVRLHARMVEAMCNEEKASTSDYNTQGMVSAIQLSEPR